MPNLPETMGAIEITSPGGPEALHYTSRPVPRPAAGEVLIKVAAAGVNRPDVFQRQGKYAPPPGVSDLPGLEVAGTIVDLGPDTPRWHRGDRVCALVAGGGYAEYCVAPAVQCLEVPGGLDSIEAAALPETCFTVWTNVFERGGLMAGESLLVHGGSSGIGTTAIPLAAARGARVFTTAGSPEKCAACQRLGAERAIDHRREDFVAVVLALTGDRGVDVILDMVGGDYFTRNLRVLALGGRLVQIAHLRGAKVELDLSVIMQKRLTVTGSTLRPRSPAEKGAIARALEREVWPLVEAGRFRPLVHSTYALARAAEAHRVMEAGEHVGKLVLLVGA